MVLVPYICALCLPRDIITNDGPYFAGNKIAATLKNYHVQHKIITPYHPQENG